ncbi:MAG TPA: nuclear transport factor 2 family protein [Gemmatimonadales bacterium]|nr:nuclear transport factor 2 family protein [Gemmatimonadales bacterium]
MRDYRLPALAALAAVAALTGAAVHENADEAAVRATIQHYFDGGMEVRKAFHPSARMTFVADTGFSLVPIESYLQRVEEAARKNPEGRGWPEKRIADIDITGDAAVARLELGGPQSSVTDYMTLLRIDGTWLIVNKTFTRKAAPAQSAR